MTKELDDPSGSTPSSQFAKPLFALLLVGAIAGAAIFVWTRSRPNYDQITASAGRIGLEQDDGKHRAIVDRRQRQELWFRVTLGQVPLGVQVPLECEWAAPDGRIVHRNRYETRTIDKTPWDTHARYQLAVDSPLGTWTVKLSLPGHVGHVGHALRSTTFEVRDGVAAEDPEGK